MISESKGAHTVDAGRKCIECSRLAIGLLSLGQPQLNLYRACLRSLPAARVLRPLPLMNRVPRIGLTRRPQCAVARLRCSFEVLVC